MLDRVRNWAGLGESATGQRRLSQREREYRQRRLLYLLAIIAAVAVVLILIGGAVYQYILVPRQVYATVNGEEIHRSEYVQRRKYELLQQMARLSQQIQTADQSQQAGLQQQFDLLQTEFQQLQDGDKNIDPEALKTMVENQLVLQSLDEFGITISEQELDDFVNQMLVSIPLTDPTPTPTVRPTAAAWATQTTEAFQEQSTATAIVQSTAALQTAVAATTATAQAPTATPGGPTATPAPPTSTPQPSPTPTLDPDAPTPTVDPNAPTPTPTVEPTATLSHEEAVGTAESAYDLLDRNFLDEIDMSRGEFEQLIAKPLLARQKISEQLASQVEPVQEQVRASHILVATEEAARELIEGRLQTEDFAEVAKDVSTDTATAENGGDLGWFPRGVMAEPFEEAAFSLEVGEMTQEPVHTQFGWHIIKVTDHAESRPLTETMLNQVKANAFNRWLEEKFEQADVSSEVTLPVDDQPGAGTG